jgi:hypothetical protein
MTKVKKPVYRETVGGILERGKVRPVIVSVEPPNIIGFRLKGMRTTYHLTAEGCFLQAVKAKVSADKREKAKAKGKKPRREVTRGAI